MTDPVEAFHDSIKYLKESLTVLIVSINRLMRIPPGSYMVKRSRVFYP